MTIPREARNPAGGRCILQSFPFPGRERKEERPGEPRCNSGLERGRFGVPGKGWGRIAGGGGSSKKEGQFIKKKKGNRFSWEQHQRAAFFW